MSQFTALSAFNGDTTPAEIILAAIDRMTEAGVSKAVWRSDTVGLPQSMQVEVTLNRQTLKSGTIRTDVQTVVPIVDTSVVGAPKLLGSDKLITTFYSSALSDTAKRRSARHLHGNIVLGQNWTSPAIATGNIPEAMDIGAMPV